jgi:5-methylcytosine-specific restriction endonuclease McrA
MPHNRHIPVSQKRVCFGGTATAVLIAATTASTIDHVVPRSRGGQDAWDNLVACCLKCNNIKGDRTPAEIGWRLLTVPKTPHGTSWLVRGIERPQERWEGYLAQAA